MRCYIASSWKNSIHAAAVTTLRSRGIHVYDYRNPPDRPALTEADLDGPSGFLKAARAMEANFSAIQAADFVIAVLPGGASTHVEIGYALAAHVPTFAYYIEEPRRDAFHVYLPRIQDLHNYNFDAAVKCFHKGTVPTFRVPGVCITLNWTITCSACRTEIKRVVSPEPGKYLCPRCEKPIRPEDLEETKP